MKPDTNEKLIDKLYFVIHWSVRLLAILMVFVIVMGVIDVGWTLYQKLVTPPLYILTISDMLATFGAFLAVLIAIEIFINITIYLREDVIHVKIVMATALMAIARKVIIMDHESSDPYYILAVGAVVLAMSIGYWLIHKLPRKNHLEETALHTGSEIKSPAYQAKQHQ
ncbi:phosphate-starvation-inducible PsiE family protein [Spartinivicinus ruber]|uniref:phosphate-starvation-inducible PsiE family protein n=1 Tax=Spartinivicinus ruber TaxID=2683272 RepID=UPI0013D84579|nr:phosphate-starvation-inducible PsiE family protein [Spartinivicinus ruber]